MIPRSLLRCDSAVGLRLYAGAAHRKVSEQITVGFSQWPSEAEGRSIAELQLLGKREDEASGQLLRSCGKIKNGADPHKSG
jgi:hypothetical protein